MVGCTQEIRELVIDPSFTAAEVASIEAAAEKWNEAVPGLNIVTRVGDDMNVFAVTGETVECGAETANATDDCKVLGSANNVRIKFYMDVIEGPEEFHAVATHEMAHWLGVNYHNDDGACTSPWARDCMDGISEVDKNSVKKENGL